MIHHKHCGVISKNMEKHHRPFTVFWRGDFKDWKSNKELCFIITFELFDVSYIDIFAGCDFLKESKQSVLLSATMVGNWRHKNLQSLIQCFSNRLVLLNCLNHAQFGFGLIRFISSYIFCNIALE